MSGDRDGRGEDEVADEERLDQRVLSVDMASDSILEPIVADQRPTRRDGLVQALHIDNV